jgi:hypothetical protein
VAIKKSSREKTAGFQELGNLRCDRCGEEFFIGHSPASVDKSVAEMPLWYVAPITVALAPSA